MPIKPKEGIIIIPETKTEFYVACDGVRIDSVENSYPDLSAAEDGFKDWAQLPGKTYLIVKEKKETEIYVMKDGQVRAAWYVGRNRKGQLFVGDELSYDDKILFGPLDQEAAQDKAKQLAEEEKK